MRRIPGCRTALAVLAATLLLLPLPAAAQDEHLLTDPCGAFATTGSGEPATLPHLDVCTADVDTSYDDRSLVLDLAATFAGELSSDARERPEAMYRIGWTRGSDGCNQYVEVRAPLVGTPPLFVHGCESTDQVVSANAFSADSCLRNDPYVITEVCYGEAAQWTILPHDTVTMDGQTLTVSLPVHLVLGPDGAEEAGFAPGAVLEQLTVTSYLRATNANTRVHESTVGLLAETRTVSPTDRGQGGDVTLPAPPEGWDPQPSSGAPTYDFGQGITATTTDAGRAEVVVAEDTTITASDVSVTGGGEHSRMVFADLDNDHRFQIRDGSISVAVEDAESQIFPYGNVSSDPGFRTCPGECRLPAGDYTLILATSDPDAPITATIRAAGATSEPTTLGSLKPIASRLSEGPPVEVSRDESTGSGGGFGGGFDLGTVDLGPALVDYVFTTEVESQLAGRLEISGCATTDGACDGSTSTHTYVANAVEGREGLSSSSWGSLSPGAHGFAISYTYDQAGGVEFTANATAFFVYPRS